MSAETERFRRALEDGVENEISGNAEELARSIVANVWNTVDDERGRLIEENEQLRKRVAELESLTAQAIQFRVEGSDGAPALLIRRSLRGMWAVVESEARGRRKALTRTGWRIAAVLADSDVFCWPDAVTAMTEARNAASDEEAAR